MSTISYIFGYPGELAAEAGVPAALNLASSLASGDGYYMTRAYYIQSIAITWSSAENISNSQLLLTNGETTLETIDIAYEDLAIGYVAAEGSAELAAGDRLSATLYAGVSASIYDLTVVVELSTVGVSEEAVDVLPNISVSTTILQTVKPNITQYLKDGEFSFEEIILNQKRELYGEIKMQEAGRRPTWSNADIDTLLAKVQDYPVEKFLQNRLKHMVVGWILMDNRLYEEADYYIQHGKSIPIRYYIDEDADSTAGDTEQSFSSAPRFGR